MAISVTAAGLIVSAFFCFPFFHRHTTIRVPLCPKIAAVSTAGASGMIINSYAAKQAEARKIVIEPLSPFVAEISGKKRDIKWFVNNYPLMLCSFDPAQVPNDESVYITCVQNAPRWIQIVQSQTPEDLMLQQTHFAGVCVE